MAALGWLVLTAAGVPVVLQMFVRHQPQSIRRVMVIASILVALSVALLLFGIGSGYVGRSGKIAEAKGIVLGLDGDFEEVEPGQFYEIELRGKAVDDATLTKLRPLLSDVPDVYLTLHDTSVSCQGARDFQNTMPRFCVVVTDLPDCKKIGP